MPVDLQLDASQRRLTYGFTDPLTIEQLLEAYDRERALRDSSPHIIHSITDFTGLKRIPPRWLTAKAGPGFTHPRAGYILFVNMSPGLSILVKTIVSIVNFERIRYFNTRAEAETFIDRVLAIEDAGQPQP
jgi:hypothetical protein